MKIIYVGFEVADNTQPEWLHEELCQCIHEGKAFEGAVADIQVVSDKELVIAVVTRIAGD